MTFLDQLTAHIGGLVCFKNDLFYYSNDLPVKVKGRYFIVLETEALNLTQSKLFARTACCPAFCGLQEAEVNLLIDEEQKWVRFTNKCVEIIK